MRLIMRRTLGPLLIAPLLAVGLMACGSDDAGTATDPVDTSTRTIPSGTPPATTGPDQTQPGGSDEGGYEVVGLYSATAAGGTATDQLTPIGTDAELDAYLAQFRGSTLADDVRTAVDAVQGGDGELLAAVVGLGCDIPPGVEVAPSGDTLTVQPQKVADPLPECLAPVTTVVVISVGT